MSYYEKNYNRTRVIVFIIEVTMRLKYVCEFGTEFERRHLRIW